MHQSYPVLLSLALLTACNAAPTGLAVSVTPAAPTAADELVVSIDSEAVDDNGDEVQYLYQWTRDGVVASGLNDATVRATETAKGEVWEVRVTPFDGKANGDPVAASVEIANAPPVVTAAITPTDPLTDDSINVDVESSDADLDTVTLSYRWVLNGSPTQETGKRLPAERTNKGEVWEVIISSNDGEDDGEDVTLSVSIGNTPPEVAEATVTSDSGRIDRAAVLQCVGSGWQDIDDDTEDYTVRWFVNDAEVTGETGTLSGGFVRGDQVKCELTPFDGDDSGAPVTSAPVVVQNTAPSLASVVIGPDDPTRGQEVVATLGEAVDADGDTISFEYSWRVDGRESGATPTLPSSRFVRGSKILLVVTPTDRIDAGESVTSNELEGGNNLPEISAASLSPVSAYTDSTVEASIMASDPDGDRLSTTIEWYVNGSKISHATPSLDGATWFEKEDEVYAIVRASDGAGTSPALTTSTLTVLNSRPTAPELSLSPSEPDEGDDIVCKIDAASTDADGDSLTYTFTWTVEGSAAMGSTTTYTNDTLSSSDWSEGDKVACTVVAFDGDDSGEPGEARTAGLTTELDFPSSGSSLSSGGVLGSGGGGAFFRTGDYVTETFKATGVTDVDELDYEVEMYDGTTSTCKVGTLRFDVSINGTVVDTYSYVGGSTRGRIKFTESASFTKVKGTGADGDDYILRIESKDTVCPGASSWNWYPGGVFTFNP